METKHACVLPWQKEEKKKEREVNTCREKINDGLEPAIDTWHNEYTPISVIESQGTAEGWSWDTQLDCHGSCLSP